MDFNKEEYFNVLTHNYLSGQACNRDVEDLLLWINESEDNKKQFIALRRAWVLTSQATPKGRFNKAKYDEWRKLSAKIDEHDDQIPVVFLTSWQKFIRIAAAFLIFLSIGSVVAWRVTSSRLHNVISNDIIHKIEVPFGSKTEITLPDGTRVSLNAGSKLSYSNSYGFSGREVHLEGEGYFDVQTNPQLPFTVDAFGLKIKALGTKFNVKAYPEEQSLTTTLIEGIVKIEGDDVNLTMAPRQKITYIKTDTDKLIPLHESVSPTGVKQSVKDELQTAEEPRIRLSSNVNTYEHIAWKDGRLIFKAEKLSSLAVSLERKFDVAIKINSEELLNYKFTGTFHQETLEQILNIINLSAPMKYQIEKGVVTIQLDPKRRAVFRDVISK